MPEQPHTDAVKAAECLLSQERAGRFTAATRTADRWFAKRTNEIADTITRECRMVERDEAIRDLVVVIEAFGIKNSGPFTTDTLAKARELLPEDVK